MKPRKPLSKKLSRQIKIYLAVKKSMSMLGEEEVFGLCGWTPGKIASEAVNNIRLYKSKRKMRRDFGSSQEETEAAYQFFNCHPDEMKIEIVGELREPTPEERAQRLSPPITVRMSRKENGAS